MKAATCNSSLSGKEIWMTEADNSNRTGDSDGNSGGRQQAGRATAWSKVTCEGNRAGDRQGGSNGDSEGNSRVRARATARVAARVTTMVAVTATVTGDSKGGSEGDR